MSRAAVGLDLGPVGRPRSRVSTRLPRHSAPAPSGHEQQRPDRRSPSRNSRIMLACSLGDAVGATGGRRDDDADLLASQQSARRALGDLDELARAARPRAVGGVDRARARARPRRTSGSTCPAARKPSTSAGLESARTAPRSELGAGVCGRSRGRSRPAAPARPAPPARARSPPRGRPARRTCSGRPLGLAGAASVDGQVDGQRRRAARRGRRTAARPAGPAGATRRARRSASMSGTQPRRPPVARARAARAGRTGTGPSPRPSRARHQQVRRGVRVPDEISRALVVAGDRHDLELLGAVVLADHADRRDAEARERGDALGDQLQRVADSLGPTRARTGSAALGILVTRRRVDRVVWLPAVLGYARRCVRERTRRCPCRPARSRAESV